MAVAAAGPNVQFELAQQFTSDDRGLFAALPADLTISVEVVNFGREAHTPPADWAAECLARSRPYTE